VSGGGHVVLPLLREAFVAPGWLSDDAFLAGDGADLTAGRTKDRDWPPFRTPR